MAGIAVAASFVESPAAVRQARHWVEGAARDIGWDRQVGDLVLAVSELVTNAIPYGARSVGVTLYLHDEHLWVSVRDDGAGRVSMRHAAPTEPGGRGLEIVDAVSDEWGVITERSSKSVWFEMS